MLLVADYEINPLVEVSGHVITLKGCPVHSDELTWIICEIESVKLNEEIVVSYP